MRWIEALELAHCRCQPARQLSWFTHSNVLERNRLIISSNRQCFGKYRSSFLIVVSPLEAFPEIHTGAHG